MSTLYLDRKELELRTQGKHLCLYEAGRKQATVPLNLIERVVIRGRSTITTGALGLLAGEGVGLLVLGGRSNRQAAILLGRPHLDARRRIAQYRQHCDQRQRGGWAYKLVRLKLRAQRRLLVKARNERPDLRKPLTNALDQMDRLLGRMLSWPMDAVDIDRLRGIEGAGASAYFGGFTQLFAPALAFTSRNRRPPRDPVNACLSLAYTLLHFEAVSAGHGAGLDPFIGFYHEPAYGRESLACDLVEPLRPRVDEWTWQLFRTKTLRSDHFSSEQQNGCLLNKTGRKLFYAEYERFIVPARRLLRRFAGFSARRLIDDQGSAE